MAQTALDGVDGVLAAVGQHLGHSEWLAITQERVDQFAEATDDHQWIHVDPERAERESPFGRTIAHGYLTLSLVSALSAQIIEAKGFRMGVNYGADKIRFMSPVPVGARIRASATLDDAKQFEGGVQMTLGITMEIENHPKPAMVAAILFRRYL
jgi:acyl dehydratase